jgi:hypothetical protein
MRHIRGRSLRNVLACVLSVVAFCLWPVLPGSWTAAERASRWALSREADLPVELEEYRLYPVDYQRAILSRLDIQDKRRIWRQYLVDAADTEPSLTEPQRAFLREFATAVAADDWNTRLPMMRRSSLSILGQHANLVTLGNATRWTLGAIRRQILQRGVLRILEPFRLSLREWILNAATVSAQLPVCNCRVLDGGLYDCVGQADYKECEPNTPSPPYLCQETLQDCGSGGLQVCDGMCYYYVVCPIGFCDAGSWDPSCCCCRETPILIGTEARGVRLTDQAHGVMFDMGGNGRPHLTAWTAPGSGSGWLALDRDGDGLITSAKELFGNVTEQPPVANRNGFRALAVFDDNQDDEITAADAVYSLLRVWVDENQDGVSQPNELRSLAELGITNIDLSYRQSRRRDRFGNEFRYVGKLTGAGWNHRVAWDVILANQM